MSRRNLAIMLIAPMLLGLVAAAPAAGAKKKKKKPAPCAAYTPGELGAEAPTVVLTDAAAEAAPVTQTVALDMSAANLDVVGTGLSEPTRAYFHVQVDTALPEAGLYMKMEFDPNRDYDLWLRHAADASAAASAHEWNTAYLPGVGYPPVFSGNGSHGNESTAGSEALVGIKTADCGGYTVEVENWLGEGGDMPITLWLGAAAVDPLPVGQEPRG